MKKKRRSKNGILEYEPPVVTRPNKLSPKFKQVWQTRTRANELAILKALLDTMKDLKSKDAIHDVLVDNLTQHPWMAIYFRCVFDKSRTYGLKSKHLKKVKFGRSGGRMSVPLGFFMILTGLQFKKFAPMQAAKEWQAVLMELPEDLQETANRVLDKDFSPLTTRMINKALEARNIEPLIPITK